MSNQEIAEILDQTAKLMSLHDENPFKVKSYQTAAFKLERNQEDLKGRTAAELEKVDGIGKSLSVKIFDLLNKGVFEDLNRLMQQTPEGVLQMMHIKGIGPKKVSVLWKELGVETIGELMYACKENRLIELKGFGAKTQDQVLKALEFTISNQGLFHYATVDVFANEFENVLKKNFQNLIVSRTGSLRRKNEVLDAAEFVVAEVDLKEIKNTTDSIDLFDQTKTEFTDNKLKLVTTHNLKVVIHASEKSRFAFDLFNTSANAAHFEKLKSISGFEKLTTGNFNNEEEIYRSLNLSFIEPELREGLNEIEWAQQNKLPKLVVLTDLKGILHNHSTYSDGIHTLEQMASYCKELGYEYLGICDHSKSAFYANGLQPERVLQQHAEIDELNKKLAPFHIFKGIESDILNDGSLDYDEDILQKFDFIVASVHSNLRMSEEKATQRVIAAVKNPYTTILGHPTGRLLLARAGYPIDHKAVIDACAEHGVVIELNAHPYRLDLDWRWIQYALSKGVKISINPDAHHKEGYHDLNYGVCVARKGMLSKENTFNALSKEEIEKHFMQRKNSLVAKFNV